MIGVDNQARDQSHQKFRDTSMAHVLDWTDVVGWLVDRFNSHPLLAHDLVHQTNSSLGYRLATPREPFHPVNQPLVVSSLGEIFFVPNEWAD